MRAATPAAAGDWSTWSRTVSITAEGTHTIAANVRDNAGNFRTIGVNVIVSSSPPAPDTTIPNISITSPAGGSTLPRGDILVQGTASDNPGGSGVRDVTCKSRPWCLCKQLLLQTPGNWSTWSRTVSITAGRGSYHQRPTLGIMLGTSEPSVSMSRLPNELELMLLMPL